MASRYFNLITRIREGDAEGVSNFVRENPESATFRFPPGQGTALHLAANLGKVEVAKELLDGMDYEDLEIQDSGGSTALHIAASSGHRRLVELMVLRNSDLVMIVNKRKMIPLREACGKNHKELATLLYRSTPFNWLCEENDGVYGANILKCCILDIALDMLRRRPSMAVTMDASKINVVVQLSSMPTAFPSGNPLVFWLRWIYSYPGTKHIYDLKRVHICSLELLDLAFQHISRSDFRKLEKMGVYESFHKAIKNGIVEFVMRAVKACPVLLYKFDNDGRNMFMSAVEFRQEKIFNLLYPLPDRPAIVSLVDKDKNTMLHLAGMLSPDAKLSHISGAALQMQREIQWFLEVERIINPMYKDNTNSNNETARQIFTRTHKDLASAGEKWMKETASSSTVVGALIITIMFTAAFTIPGGNNQETGIPILLHEKAFKIFMISDSISLFAASTSVLMFLGILTSRYAEADFLWSLPTKLVIGLSTLFISIAAMMVTFCATVMIAMDKRLEYVVPIILLASVPVSLFMLLQFPLLVQIFRSTYGSGIFKRNMKSWL
ncbi:Ankyrin repeat-containing protein NPR4 [Linum perenne]